MADLGEVAHAGRGRIGDKSEAVSVRQRRHHRLRRRSSYSDSGRVLHETPTHLVYRFIGCISGDHPAPLQLKRVDDPFHQIDRSIDAHDAVRNCERIIDAEVLYANSGASAVYIGMEASLGNSRNPEDASRGNTSVVGMRAQRARQAVKSNKRKWRSSLDQVRTDKHPI